MNKVGVGEGIKLYDSGNTLGVERYSKQGEGLPENKSRV